MIYRYIQTRTFKISTLVLIIFSIICTRLPLLNYLGFEFSACTVPIAGFISGIFTLVQWDHNGFRHKSDVWHFITDILLVQLVLLMIPIIISLANALLVKNCSIGNGILLYALIVVPGVFFSVSLALMLGALCRKLQKTIFTSLYILILLHIVLVTILRPQIFAFNPIIGYFPGFTYDETLQIMQRIFIYRLATLAGSACLLGTMLWLWDRKQRLQFAGLHTLSDLPLIEWMLIALLGPIVIVVFILSNRIGLSSSEDFIKQKLGGSYRTAHFDIIYPTGVVKREKIEQLGLLHEFYYGKLCKELAIHPVERISSFIYESPEQKGRLIGAIHTNISKPWLRQMHINFADIESVLKHEMVHILAAEFGWSPLKIAPNSGLIEGLAVAMQGSAYEEPLDRAAALTFAAGVHPGIERLFSITGFAQLNAGVSYTLAGSFCNYLIHKYGLEKFKEFYQTGRFSEIAAVEMERVIGLWADSIKNVPLTSSDSIKAKYFFCRPSIFGKECARVLADLNSEIQKSITRRDFEEALASAERSLALSPTPQAIFQKTTALFELRQFEDVLNFTGVQLHDATLNYTLLPLHIRRGDAYWMLDSLSQARQEYEMIAQEHLGVWYEEACVVRLNALKDLQERPVLCTYFSYTTEDTTRIARLERLTGPIARYLLAREYAAKERFRECVSVLESLGSMQTMTLEYFRLHRLGKAWFEVRKYSKAESAFKQSLSMAPSPYLQMETADWIERCEFCSKYPSEGSKE